MCIFCDEEDDEFNEDTLISHYYNVCPVLTNCPMCQIVSEEVVNIYIYKERKLITHILDLGSVYIKRSFKDRL